MKNVIETFKKYFKFHEIKVSGKTVHSTEYMVLSSEHKIDLVFSVANDDNCVFSAIPVDSTWFCNTHKVRWWCQFVDDVENIFNN